MKYKLADKDEAAKSRAIAKKLSEVHDKVVAEQEKKEQEEAKELFGDQEPFLIPDTPYL